jgi:hypothetical protein
MALELLLHDTEFSPYIVPTEKVYIIEHSAIAGIYKYVDAVEFRRAVDSETGRYAYASDFLPGIEELTNLNDIIQFTPAHPKTNTNLFANRFKTNENSLVMQLFVEKMEKYKNCRVAIDSGMKILYSAAECEAIMVIIVAAVYGIMEQFSSYCKEEKTTVDVMLAQFDKATQNSNAGYIEIAP